MTQALRQTLHIPALRDEQTADPPDAAKRFFQRHLPLAVSFKAVPSRLCQSKAMGKIMPYLKNNASNPCL